MNNKKRLSTVIVAVMMLAFVSAGAAGFVLWQNSHKPKKEISITETKEDEEIAEEVVEESSTEKPVSAPASNPKASQAEIGSTPQPEKTGKENFEITQWGVTGYYSGRYKISYEVDKAGNLEFKSDELTGGCKDTAIGLIQRRAGDELMGKVQGFSSSSNNLDSNKTVADFFAQKGETSHPHANIGQYYYFLIAPQTGCIASGDPREPLPVDIYNEIVKYFNTLVAV